MKVGEGSRLELHKMIYKKIYKVNDMFILLLGRINEGIEKMLGEINTEGKKVIIKRLKKRIKTRYKNRNIRHK
jgi:hypothetical protein